MRKDKPEMKGAGRAGGHTPVLGLSVEGEGQEAAVPSRWGWAVGTVYDQPEPD